MISNPIVSKVIENIKQNPNIPMEEKFKVANSILDSIIDNVLTVYKKIHPSETSATKPNEKKFSLSSIIGVKQNPQPQRPLFLTDYIDKHKIEIIRIEIFEQKARDKQIPLYHIRVHQQFVGNLCGYHALFSLREVLHMLRAQNLDHETKIHCPAHFWKYHFESTTYLDNFAKMNNLIRDKYPWTYRVIRWGELERAFVKYLTTEHPQFQKLLESTETMKLKLNVFQFQFKRILSETNNLKELQTDFEDFLNDRSKTRHNVKLYLLGVTNHWMLMVAHKFNDRSEFWFLDSHNRDYLVWSEDEIAKYIAEESQRRIKNGKTPWNKFQQWVHHNAMSDTQMVIKIIANCLLGNATIFNYFADQEMDVQERGFLENFQLSQLYEQYPNFEKTIENYTADEFSVAINELDNYCTCYGESLYLFFKAPEKLNAISEEGKKILRKISNIASKLITDKRYKNTHSWIYTYKGTLKYAGTLAK